MKKLLFVLQGFLVGLCDLIPGVSGGTMAFILGIYERFIGVIRACNIKLLQFWHKKNFTKAIKKLDLGFAIPFFSGIVIALLVLANLLHHVVTNYFFLTYAFFFGLIISSLVVLKAHLQKPTHKRMSFLFVGLIIGLLLTLVTQLALPHTWYILIISGFVAALAMLLPGISGSYMLVVLGQYEFFTEALKVRDFSSLFLIVIGIGLGLYLMSHIISYLLKNQKQLTLYFLFGIVLGSLKLFIDKIGLNWNAWVVLWFVLGIALPIFLTFIGKRRTKNKKK